MQIQIDNSGVGHNWRNIDAQDIPGSIVLEIEGEIIDGYRRRDAITDAIGAVEGVFFELAQEKAAEES